MHITPAARTTLYAPISKEIYPTYSTTGRIEADLAVDIIARVSLTTGKNELLIITKGGQGLRVSEKEFRPMGCAARGVKGINLKKEDDEVLSCDVVNDKKKMLLISEKGIGKRLEFSSMTPHHRATSGMIIMNLSERTGRLAASLAVNDTDELVAITSQGMVIRTAINAIRVLGRRTTGVITIRLSEGDSVADCSIVKGSEPESESGQESPKISEDMTLKFEDELK